MKISWKRVKSLINKNAEHRKGFKLQEVDLPSVLDQALLEIVEIRDAPDEPQKMADLFGVLIQYCIKQGWTCELIESLLAEKLKSRFK